MPAFIYFCRHMTMVGFGRFSWIKFSTKLNELL